MSSTGCGAGFEHHASGDRNRRYRRRRIGMRAMPRGSRKRKAWLHSIARLQDLGAERVSGGTRCIPADLAPRTTGPCVTPSGHAH